MARKIKTEKERKNQRKKIIIIFMLLIVLVAIVGYGVWKFKLDKPTPKATTVNVLDSISEYGYSLNDKDSKYFKSEYDELSKILKSDEVNVEEYATKVARLFVIDFYTLSTKMNKYDIGGNEFFFENKKSMFEQKAMDTLYSTVSDNTYGDRKQELPEVKNVETVSTEEQVYEINDEKNNCYLVKLKIDYTKKLGYDDEASVVVCKENELRWSVVDIQPTLSPKYNTK